MNLNEVEILYSKEQIAARVSELGRQIGKDYAGGDLLVLGILKGAFIFMSDLVRQIEGVNLQLDFMSVSSYGASSESSGEVRILRDLDSSVEGKHVLVVEDIIDTGLTLGYIRELLLKRGALSVKLCCFLDKPSRRKGPVTPDYTGYSIPDQFVVGYGLDYAERYRYYPAVCILKSWVYEKNELVIVLDFGGQYNQLIARRVRELSVYCEMVPYDISYREVVERNPQGIILTGGPASVHVENAPACDPRIFEMNVPVLGICYGMQLLAHTLGGQVRGGNHREYGRAQLAVTRDDLLFNELPKDMQVWMSHGDSVFTLPEGFVETARTGNCPVAAMYHPEKHLYGVQFHPEVKHTVYGMDILKNFLFAVCGLKGDWNLSDFIAESVADIKAKVGSKKVLCALSGGVDSSVAAVLVHRAVGDQLVCVFVDNGLLRKDEPQQVIQTFQEQMQMNLIFADAQDRFLKRLAGVTEPERKRKIIGEEFIRVFEEEKNKLGDIDYLVQGTIYPDVIESGTRTADTIKSHHNVGGLPEDMDFELLEPLRLLFKDEVRLLGEELGIPAHILWRQPFPGPGLGVRVLEEITAEKLTMLKEADAIVREEISKAGLDREIWQAFAVLPPVRSVGVMGDERTYAHPIIIRAVVSDDAMTAEWARLPYELLDIMSRRIVNEVRGINRVVYDVTSKPPGTIEWE